MLSALTDKADWLAHHYASQKLDVYSADRVFRMDDFTQEQLVEDKHIGASGQEYVTRLKPIDSVEQTIDRSGQNMFGAHDRDAFTVDATFTATRIDADGKGIESKTSSKLELTLVDRKTGMNILTEMYKEHGIPEATAREMAKSVFRKAELQSPERVVRLEEVRADTMKVVYGTQAAEVSTADRQTAAQKIAEQFGIPKDTAKEIVEKAEEARKSAKTAPEEAEAAEKKNGPEREARQEAESDAPADEAPKQSDAQKADSDAAKPDAAKGGNGHEKHKAPTQDVLDEMAAKKGSTTGAPAGSMPMPEVPKPKTHRR